MSSDARRTRTTTSTSRVSGSQTVNRTAPPDCPMPPPDMPLPSYPSSTIQHYYPDPSFHNNPTHISNDPTHISTSPFPFPYQNILLPSASQSHVPSLRGTPAPTLEPLKFPLPSSPFSPFVNIEHPLSPVSFNQ